MPGVCEHYAEALRTGEAADPVTFIKHLIKDTIPDYQEANWLQNREHTQ